jgi:hypothetical protein
MPIGMADMEYGDISDCFMIKPSKHKGETILRIGRPSFAREDVGPNHSSTLSKVCRILTKTFTNFHDHAVEQNWGRSKVPLDIGPPKDALVERTLFFEDNYDQPSKTPSSAATSFFDTVHRV